MIQFAAILIMLFGPLPAIYAGPIRGVSTPPAKAVVKVTEYEMIDGKRIGIQEWSDRPAVRPKK